MKTYDTSIIQCIIPLKEGSKYFLEKLKIFNPILLPTIEKEIRKLLDSKAFEILRVGSQLSPRTKKEWRHKVMCGFHKFEQVLIER